MSSEATIEVGRIIPPRTPVFHDSGRLDELTDSIRAVGLRCPLVLRPVGLGSFEIVDGHLRYQAVDALGWRDVRAVLVELDDRAAARLRLTLNAVRRTVSPLEEARLIRFLLDGGDRPTTIATTLGRSTSWVQARLDLLERLWAPLQAEVERGELSPTLAAEIAAAPRGHQESLRRAARAHGLSAHAAGRLARYLAAPERTHEERLDALANPAAVLARPGRQAPSSTPITDRIEDVSSKVLDLMRALGLARTAMTAADRAASGRAVEQLERRLVDLGHELERFKHDEEARARAQADRPLSLSGDRTAPAAAARPEGAGKAPGGDPEGAAAASRRRTAPAALEADDPALAEDLQGGGGGPAQGSRPEAAEGSRSVEEDPAGAPCPSGERA